MKDAIRTIAALVDAIFRSGGVIINLVTFGVFIYTCLWAKAGLIENLAIIGPLPALNMQSAMTLAHDPLLVAKLVAGAKAWGFGIVAVGTGWMSLLGLRWTFHACLALIHRLKVI
jgi:hypothetical protein